MKRALNIGMGLFFCLSLKGANLCDVVMHQLEAHAQYLTGESQEYLAMAVHQAIVQEARKRAFARTSAEPSQKKGGSPKKKAPNPYREVIETVDPSLETKRTLHSTAKDNADLLTNDVRFVLQLPELGQKPVWSLLSPKQRIQLMQELADDFKRGQYDLNALSTAREEDNQIRSAMERAETAAVEAGAGFDVTGAISPLLLLDAAREGKLSGVCRQGNCALAGLASELGAPKDDIRLVSGKSPDGKNRHLWLEMRVGPNDQWMEFDATATGESVEQIFLNSLLGNSSPPLRERFPNEIKIRNEFFVPVKSDSVPIPLAPDVLQLLSRLK